MDVAFGDAVTPCPIPLKRRRAVTLQQSSGSPCWEYHLCPARAVPHLDMYPSEVPVVHISSEVAPRAPV
jgi:hypothetical protein